MKDKYLSKIIPKITRLNSLDKIKKSIDLFRLFSKICMKYLCRHVMTELLLYYIINY